MPKFLFITGGVMSGIGKGVTTASMGKILQVRGYRVSAMKIDPYLNVDAGTMNPYIHGEVFVTDDGGEIDMDLGTYERFLDLNLSKDHNITTGQVYLSIAEKERRGEFLGKCVQIIPHVTDEIKARIRNVATKNQVDVLLIEVGGTVGDIEGLPYLEAARQMRLEESYRNVVNAHVTLVPVLDVVGEQKTKPTQHSVQELRRIGIQPDLIVARSDRRLAESARKKIALFCNVEEQCVFSSPDVETIYEAPLVLDEQGIGEFLIRRMDLVKNDANWVGWKNTVQSFKEPKYDVKVAICGKYTELADSYVSVNEALRHAGAYCGAKVNIDWIESEVFEEDPIKLRILSDYNGVLVPGGFGSRGSEGKVAAIKYVRSFDIPYLGICFGFQLAVVEFSRQLGLEGANSTEVNPPTPHPVIDLMLEQKTVDHLGATMRLGAHEIEIKNGTTASKLYEKKTVLERHRHRYEVNPEYIPLLEKGGLVFSGASDSGRRMEILECPSNFFHVATQFHAEFKSRPGRPAPCYYGFVKSCLDKRLNKPAPEL